METQLIDRFKKNDTEEIRISVREYKNRFYLDLRLFFQPKESGEYVPSKKGITIPVEFLSQLKDGLEKVVVPVALAS